MDKLEGKIALVTGGNSGIGLATAKQFVRLHHGAPRAGVQEIGRDVTGVQGDVSNLGDLDRLFARIKREKGLLFTVQKAFPPRPWGFPRKTSSRSFTSCRGVDFSIRHRSWV